MTESFAELLLSGPFMPHGHCYLWMPALVWLHVTADTLIALAYYALPLLLVYFVRKRRDLPYHWMFLMFGAFIIACGTTHVMEVWTLWYPTYWLSGGIKLVTATISLATAVLLIPLLPHALALPSPSQMETINRQLQSQVLERQRAEAALQAAHDELEHRVEERTAALAQANAAMQESERRYRSLFENNPFPMWVYDCETLAFLDVNHAAIEGYGYARADFLSMMLPDIRLDDAPPLSHGSGTNLPPDADAAKVWKHVKHDGSEIHAEVSSHAIDYAGRQARLELANDVTQRLQAVAEIRRLNEHLEQRVLERTAQLESSNRELETFSYSVSHDLRAPLRSIDGFSQALLEDYSDLLDSQGQQHLERIRSASQRMAELIDALLGLSRVTRAELERAPVDLSAMAVDIIADLQRHEPTRVVEVSIAPALQAVGDPRLLRLVMENLLGNAWKFSAHKVPARIDLGVQMTPDGTAVFFVRDNGAGFDMQYSDKLFGAFQRLHRSSEFPGTGIGLATVQRIIRRHGGRIWAEGVVGEGATVYFVL